MKLSLNLPAALVAALKSRAAADRRSLSNLVALLLEQAITASGTVPGRHGEALYIDQPKENTDV